MDDTDERIERLLDQPDDIMVTIITFMPLHEMLRLARVSLQWRARFITLTDRVLFNHPSIHEAAREEYRSQRASLSRADRYDYMLAAAYILTYPRVRAWRICRILGRPESIVSNAFARFCILLLLPPIEEGSWIHGAAAMHTFIKRSEMESIFPESDVHSWSPERDISLLTLIVVYLLRCNRSIPAIFETSIENLPVFLDTYLTIDRVLTFFVIPYLSEETMAHLQPWLLDYPSLNPYDYPTFWEQRHFTPRMATFLSHFIPKAKVYDPRVSDRARRTIQNLVLPSIRMSDREDRGLLAAGVHTITQRFYWTMDQREQALRLLPVLLARHAALVPVDLFTSLPLNVYDRAPEALEAILNGCILEDKDGVILVFIKELIAAKYYDLANRVLNHPNVLLYRRDRLIQNYTLLQDQVSLHVS
jgi:hypothetical protein